MRKVTIIGVMVLVALAAYACIVVGTYEDPHLGEVE